MLIAPMEGEVAQLLGRFKPILNKRSGIALGLWGEAGIGKTWTASQLLRQASCKNFSLHATAPLRGLVKALYRPNKLPSWAEVSLERIEQGEHLQTKAIADTLAALLSAQAPVILHLEDLHEAWPERLELWQSLAQTLSHSRGVGLLITSRTQPPEPFQAIRLQPMPLEDLSRLLEGEIGTAVPREAAAWIYQRALGNPLFGLEYLRFLTRQGHLWNDGQRWRWRTPPSDVLPTTIEALLEHLLFEAQSPPQTQAALWVKALLPINSGQDLWAKVAGLSAEQLHKAQLELQQRGILNQGAFSHPLLQEVVAQNIPPLERQNLARDILHHLQAHDPIAAAGFLDQARLEPSQAFDLLLQAAQLAQSQGDALGSARWKAQASEYTHGEAQGKLALEAAQILQQYDLAAALELGQKALLFPTLADQALSLVGLLLARSGDMSALEHLLTSAGHSNTQLELNVLRLQAQQLAGQHPKVIELWENNSDLQATAESKVLYAVAISYLALGQTQKSQAILEQALALPLSPVERRDFWGIGAIVNLNQGKYPQAAQLFEQAVKALRSAGDRRKQGAMLHNLSIVYKELLDYPKAQAALQEALELRLEMGDHKAYAHSLALMAELQVELGQQSQAEAGVEEALGILQLYGASHFLINVHSQASYIYSLPQTPLAKLLQLKHANKALEYAQQSGNPRLQQEMLYDHSVAQTRNSNSQSGLSSAQKIFELAPQIGDPPQYRWRAHFASALALEAMGQKQQAIEHLSRAQSFAEQIPDWLNLHKLGLETARLNNDPRSAQQHLDWFRERALMSGVYLALRYFPQLSRIASQSKLPEVEGLPRLGVLGPMQLQSTQIEAMRGNKRKELLALLLEARLAGHTEVSNLQLLDALYPGADENQASASLRDLIHQIRGSLGTSAILTTGNGYALGLESDAEDFLKSGNTQLWRGVYLEDLSLDMPDSAVPEALYQALAQKLETLLEADPKEAARLGRILLSADPYDTQALRLTLLAFRNNKNHKSLTRLYDEAKERMSEVGETLPKDWREFLSVKL